MSPDGSYLFLNSSFVILNFPGFEIQGFVKTNSPWRTDPLSLPWTMELRVGVASKDKCEQYADAKGGEEKHGAKGSERV